MRKVSFIIAFTMLAVFLKTVSGQEISPYKVSRLSFNQPSFSDISPVILKDGIMFCSDRRLSGVTDRTSFDNRRLYSIYIAARKDSTEWGKPNLIRSERSSLFNTGPMCIAPDGKTVYFTSEIETGVPSRSRKFKNHSGIFIAELNNYELLSLQPFKYNSPDYDLGQPSISADGRFLYFASDMPGGLGGSDIYRCELENGQWGAPVNLGPKINSSSTDNFPCVHPTGRLFFTSNRAGGFGGLDVYYSDFSNGSWETPVRFAEPINSSADDFAFTAQPDLQSGFFASNRRRSDDIYEFNMTIIRKASCNPLEKNNYCYEFIEENAIKYDTMPFLFEWRFGDGTKAIGRSVEHCYTGPGKYLVQLDVTNLVTKNVSVNEKSEMLIVEEIVQPYISCIDNADAGKALKLSADSTNLPGWQISKYYWNFGDETLAVGENVEKIYRKPGKYNIQLIVSAKPDSTGKIQEACVSKEITVLQRP